MIVNFASMLPRCQHLPAFLELRADLDAHRVAQDAKQHGVFISTIDSCYIGMSDRNDILLGYGGLSPQEVIHGAQILREVIERRATKMKRLTT
jgi:DNA-binding transcriptional MocR family regulator